MTSKTKAIMKQEPAPERRGRGRPRGSTNKPRDPNAPAPPRQQTAPKSIVADVLDRASFTVEEFRARNHISDGTWATLVKEGLAPRMMRPTGKTHGVIRISREAERDWQREAEKRIVSEEAKAADKAKRAAVTAAKKAGAR